MEKKSCGVRFSVFLIFIGLFNIVDYFATADLVVNGPHLEWNPLMRGIVATPYFPLYKLVLIPLGLFFLWKMRDVVASKYSGLVKLTFGVYASLMFYTWLVFYF